MTKGITKFFLILFFNSLFSETYKLFLSAKFFNIPIGKVKIENLEKIEFNSTFWNARYWINNGYHENNKFIPDSLYQGNFNLISWISNMTNFFRKCKTLDEIKKYPLFNGGQYVYVAGKVNYVKATIDNKIYKIELDNHYDCYKIKLKGLPRNFDLFFYYSPKKKIFPFGELSPSGINFPFIKIELLEK